ncbi:hypothetical protein QUF76_17350 [Desulfobacterales bacterium HSG16]|nr:hypothetical protein [Desulfobacterales bacterium HSG16]
MKLKQLFSIIFIVIFFNALPAFSDPYFQVVSLPEWEIAFEQGAQEQKVSPVNSNEWGLYMEQWRKNFVEGEPYPQTKFLPADLFVFPGDSSVENVDVREPGLVMIWGENELPEGNYASAWKYDYGVDPDLSNSTITVTVIPPSQSTINAISFAIQDINGNIRSWWWKVPGTIPYNVPTTVIINTAIPGIAAANPPATGYTSSPLFDITKAQFFLADENSSWMGGPLPIPPAGQQIPGLWNYWRDLIVMPNTKVNKGYHVKFGQPPFVIEDSKLILGWDDLSVYRPDVSPDQSSPILADDWLCKDDRPVTDVHWWGSFIGWTKPHPPPVIPSRFHIGIWTDVKAAPDRPSHPGELIWENFCHSYVWNFAGYDKDPRKEIPEAMQNETCFQFNQFLSQDQWFYQKPSADGAGTIYWLSIAAIYDNVDSVRYPWGWKTRPVVFNDNAVRIRKVSGVTGIEKWPPALHDYWNYGEPVEGAKKFWDLSFELTTNMAPPIVEQGPPGDFNGDRVIDLKEAIHALQVVSGLLIP